MLCIQFVPYLVWMLFSACFIIYYCEYSWRLMLSHIYSGGNFRLKLSHIYNGSCFRPKLSHTCCECSFIPLLSHTYSGCSFRLKLVHTYGGHFLDLSCPTFVVGAVLGLAFICAIFGTAAALGLPCCWLWVEKTKSHETSNNNTLLSFLTCYLYQHGTCFQFDPISVYEDSVAAHLSKILHSDNHSVVISSAK